MEYYIFKLNFTSPVHFGSGRLSDTSETFYADTLFSAIFKEILKMNGNERANKMYEAAVNGKLLLSDAMPYVGDKLYIPKPILHINAEDEGDSVKKKAFKKLKYLPLEDIDKFVRGRYEPKSNIEFGKKSIRDRVFVKENEDNEPYNVGLFKFEKGCGLYFIAGVDDESTDFIFDAMDSLCYTGIGGKITSGLGKFKYEYLNADNEIKEHIEKDADRYICLSVSMAEDNELEQALDGASYGLIKRSGFAASEEYSDKPLKKRDFYCFKGGSCFKNRFKGSIFDVSAGGRHPVYRYAKPLFLGL